MVRVGEDPLEIEEQFGFSRRLRGELNVPTEVLQGGGLGTSVVPFGGVDIGLTGVLGSCSSH